MTFNFLTGRYMKSNCNIVRLLRTAFFICIGMGAITTASASTDQIAETKKPIPTTITWVKPSDADPVITNFNEANLIIVPEGTKVKVLLVVFLPGTNGRPANTQLMLSVIAQQSYRTIGLSYNNEPAVVQVCSRNADPDCSALFRHQRIYGNVENAPISNSTDETIVHRLTKLLQYLNKTQPDAQWSDYLKNDRPDWSKIVISGLSQGAGMAAYIAQRESVARAVLFSSPWDYFGGDRSQLAPWISGPSVTPPERWFAEYHKRENTAEQIAMAYQKLRIPKEQVLIFDLDPAEKKASNNPLHSSTVKLPGYENQWKWLYGSALNIGQ